MEDQVEMTKPLPRKPILKGQNPNLQIEGQSDGIENFPSAEEVVEDFFKKKPVLDPTTNRVLRLESDYDRAKPVKRNLTRNELLDLARESLSEMAQLQAASTNPERWTIPKEVALGINDIFDYSAPGTYNAPAKNDRYRDKPWAWGMDRYRADLAARVGIVISGVATNRDFSFFAKDELLDGNDPYLNSKRDAAKQAIITAGIHFVYIARPDEGTAMKTALNQKLSFIPAENVTIISGPQVDNVLDQVRETRIYLQKQGKGRIHGNVLFVAHGPQLVRMAGVIKEQSAIPQNLTTYFFPMVVPSTGLYEYPLMETKGRLSLIIRGRSALKSCNYTILGEQVGHSS